MDAIFIQRLIENAVYMQNTSNWDPAKDRAGLEF